MKSNTSDCVDVEDLESTAFIDLKRASRVRWELYDNRRDWLRMSVVDSVLDRVTSSETEVGDGGRDSDDWGAIAFGGLSVIASWARRAILWCCVSGNATCEGSEPWNIEVTLGRERGNISTTDNLTDWVDDVGVRRNDVTRERNVFHSEGSCGGCVPDEQAREGKERLKTNLAEGD